MHRTALASLGLLLGCHAAPHDGSRAETVAPKPVAAPAAHQVTAEEEEVGLGNDDDELAAANRAIHRFAWLNMPYVSVVDGIASPPLPVVNGRAEYEINPDEHVSGWIQYSQPLFGDIDGDGVDEAVIVMTVNDGGTGDFDDANIYTLMHGKPVRVATIPGGDRADGGLRALAFEDHQLRVERWASQEGAVATDRVQIEHWGWNGEAMIEGDSPRQYVRVDER